MFIRQLLVIIALLSSVIGNVDIIRLHYGEPLSGKVTEITDEYIKYITENEDLTRTIGTIPVERI